MKRELIKQIEQLTCKKKITTWEEFDEVYKFNNPIKDQNKQQIIPPYEYRLDDNGCTRKDITKSGETLDIII